MVFHHGREEVKQSQVLVWKGTAGGYYQVGRVIPWDTVKYCGQAVRAMVFPCVCVCGVTS